MEKREFWIEDPYVLVPIWAGQPVEILEVFCEEGDGAGGTKLQKVFELRVPKGPGQPGEPKSFDAPLPVKSLIGKKVTIIGNFAEEFFLGIQNTANFRLEIQQEEKNFSDSERAENIIRPVLHFTPQTGWINDPNGLVYQNGVYHLYFQYNPFDTKWENMCWGHAVSSDLLHWEQLETALYPDATGTMFSGSGIVNERGLLGLPEDALIFFYTAAAACNAWTEEKGFTQRIAYSLDGGRTLVKAGCGVLPTVRMDNRDPKVFWHEESQAYIMVLWLYEDMFGIFRSADLESWQESSRIRLEGGWECPDLFRLTDEAGDDQWIFIAADGSYYLGEFDGYRFTQTAERKCMYMNKTAYAAQTYSNTPDRRILVAWLRMEFAGENYAGAMGLPRELSLIGAKEDARLCLRPVRELQKQREKLPDGVLFQSVDCSGGAREYRWNIANIEVYYNSETGEFAVAGEKLMLPAKIADFTFFADGPILEVTADRDTLLGAFGISAQA